ncbi:protealysin inhibitor emfourin [Arthrobacter sp. NyZ413]|uniref:protealysin inhibitor emfourin n=1 Tax=Arthrobacter sp. NyZ413 TaxID=3144669 RepID=UPI003BF91301
MDKLHIRYERSGGIAGITMAAEAAEPDLPDDVLTIAAELLGGSSGVGTPSTAEPDKAPAAPDQFTHTVQISRGGERRSFHWSDATMPEVVRPLVETLARRAEPL